MKRLPILSKMLLLLVCFSVVLSAANAGSTVNDVLNIPWVEYAPDINGDLDEDWVLGFPNVHMFPYILEVADSFHGYSDFASFYKAAWNEAGFYVYGQVVDDSVTGTADELSHANDCWEIYFDGGNEKAAEYDANDIQWRWVYGKTEIEAGWADVGNWAWATTADGYSFELAIPVAELVKAEAQLFPLEEDQVIGFETQVADNDGTGREAMTKWWAADNNSWQNPGLFGTATLADDDNTLLIPEIAYAPTIDGDLSDEWIDVQDNEIPEVKMSGYINESGMFSGDSDITSYYRVAWNEAGIYFFGRVMDDSVTGTADELSHANDCFEIYFDGGNEKAAEYDANDIQWRWVYGKTEIEAGWADCGNWEWAETADGYNFELVIPVAELVKAEAPLFDLELGTVIGWEVQVADNDGEGRESMTKWWAADNMSWQNAGLFGTAILCETAVGAIDEEPAAANIALSVAPVIASDNVVVSVSVPAGIAAKVSLFNIAGQLVKAADANGSTVSLDVSGLANGVYLCNLKAGGESATKKVMLIK